MEKREYCYDFIENNNICERKDECLLAHVIVPSHKKEEFLKTNPRPKWQAASYIDILSRRHETSINSGSFHISKCINCGKGIKFNNLDLEMNNKLLCQRCRGDDLLK